MPALMVNTIGHGTGVLLFGIFLYLVLKQRPAVRRLPVVAASLALLWNLASLIVLLLGSDGSMAERVVAAIGFSVVSVLPAVLLQICLSGRFVWVVRAGYTLSALAVVAHVLELILDAPVYHRVGLGAISLGFVALTIFVALRLPWHAEARLRSRVLATMSLLLFAMSFVHFGDGHTYEAWTAELAIHHAGIPLALFVLLSDYRFLLLDAFIRLLANGLLAGLFAAGLVSALPRLNVAIQILVCGAALGLFAWSREALQTFLTRIVFRRPDAESTERELHALRAKSVDEESFLQSAFERIAVLMSTRSVDNADRAAITIPVRLPHGATRTMLLAERSGGQPYLSEDIEVLNRLAACVSEQVEQIHEAEVRRLVSQAELRALQSQIHPHFFFNALNTLYGVIPREAAGARRMLLNLADMFRYFLDTSKTFVPLEDEMRIVRAYLAIEEMRLGPKLITEIDIDEKALRVPIPVLSIQPLVENAVKHGVAAKAEGGLVRIEVHVRGEGVVVKVTDTGSGFGSHSVAGSGVGLENVTRRLTLCFGPAAGLNVESTETGSTVEFYAPHPVPAVAGQN